MEYNGASAPAMCFANTSWEDWEDWSRDERYADDPEGGGEEEEPLPKPDGTAESPAFRRLPLSFQAIVQSILAMDAEGDGKREALQTLREQSEAGSADSHL